MKLTIVYTAILLAVISISFAREAQTIAELEILKAMQAQITLEYRLQELIYDADKDIHYIGFESFIAPDSCQVGRRCWMSP